MALASTNPNEPDLKEFEKVFRKYYEPLCRYAYSIVRDTDEAEEIVQEFFYTFWLNRNRISIRLSLKSYLYRSIRNSALRFLQHKNIEDQYRTQDYALNHVVSPEQVILGNEMASIIDKTLKGLPERTRQIFLLNRVNGLKYKEIAELLKISIKTVEADMGKALLELRLQLKRSGFYRK
jgi:RNA polymerase sigma-70 factor (ECF subfamily)